MAISTKAAAIFGILVLLQVSCAVSRSQTPGAFFSSVNVPAVMTVKGFQEGEGSGPASCDGRYYSDQYFVVSLSTVWYAGGARCGKMIHITDSTNRNIIAVVVDECRNCDYELGASANVWHTFGLDTNLGVVNVVWSDVN